MSFTPKDAVILLHNIKQEPGKEIPLEVYMDNVAKDILACKSPEELEQKLREVFKSAGTAYPEKSHALHLRATLLTVLNENGK